MCGSDSRLARITIRETRGRRLGERRLVLGRGGEGGARFAIPLLGEPRVRPW